MGLLAPGVRKYTFLCFPHTCMEEANHTHNCRLCIHTLHLTCLHCSSNPKKALSLSVVSMLGFNDTWGLRLGLRSFTKSEAYCLCASADLFIRVLEMGCGNSKVLTNSSKNGYVSFVKSFVICSNKESEIEKPRKCNGKRNISWGDHDGSIQSTGSIRQLTINDGQRQRKVEKYRAKFDSRVTAR